MAQLTTRRIPRLLLRAGGASRLAPWIIAPMAYLATLALALALALAAVAEGWSTTATGDLTVELPPAADTAESERQAVRVLALVLDWPGVLEAEILPHATVAGLIDPLLGPGLPADTLPLPTLIAVIGDSTVPIDRDDLRDALNAAAPGALLVDHVAWLGDLARTAAAIRTILIGVVSLTALAAAATVVTITSAGMRIHRRIIDLLHIMGATDGHVAGLFQRQALIAGAAGGGGGFVLAVATLAGLSWVADSSQLAVFPALTGVAWWWPLFLVPLAATLLAMLTARVTVLFTLTRLP